MKLVGRSSGMSQQSSVKQERTSRDGPKAQGYLRSKWLVLSAAGFLVMVGWTVYRHTRTPTEQERYKQRQSSFGTWTRLVALERQLPTFVARFLGLRKWETSLLQKDERIAQQLLSSGYLTNLHISFTNARSRRAEAQAVINQATGTNAGIKWEFYEPSNSMLVLTCRTQDAARLLRAFGQ